MIVWIGAMNIIVLEEDGVRSGRTQRNAMNIYALARIIHAVMENVFNGQFEWHFYDYLHQR